MDLTTDDGYVFTYDYSFEIDRDATKDVQNSAPGTTAVDIPLVSGKVTITNKTPEGRNAPRTLGQGVRVIDLYKATRPVCLADTAADVITLTGQGAGNYCALAMVEMDAPLDPSDGAIPAGGSLDLTQYTPSSDATTTTLFSTDESKFDAVATDIVDGPDYTALMVIGGTAKAAQTDCSTDNHGSIWGGSDFAILASDPAGMTC